MRYGFIWSLLAKFRRRRIEKRNAEARRLYGELGPDYGLFRDCPHVSIERCSDDQQKALEPTSSGAMYEELFDYGEGLTVQINAAGYFQGHCTDGRT